MAGGITRLSNKIKHKISPSSSSKDGSSVHTNPKESKSLQEIKAKLAENSLAELRLGYDTGEFHSKRDFQSLVHVLKEQFLHKLSLDKHSCLQSINIGWKLPAFAYGPIFQQIIPLLLQEPIRITKVTLVLRNNPIPEGCLKRIVSWPTLETLDLRSIQVMKPLAHSERGVTAVTGSLRSHAKHFHHHHSHSHGSSVWGNSNADSDSIRSDARQYSPHSWRTENIVKIVPYVSLSVKTLKLVDCGLTSFHIPELCDVIRRKMHGLQELSLRHNRELDGGYSHLFALPCIKKLDLSLCDLDAHDGLRIGKAMEKHLCCGAESSTDNNNHHLRQLSLAGNYRMSESMPEVVRLASTRLLELDCSFCDIQSKFQGQVFMVLATTPDCMLQSFTMQGTRIICINELVQCVRDNTSLRRLILNHPREPFHVSYPALNRVADALKDNYQICDLKLDSYKCDNVWRQMEFWLQLNRCGRRILLQDNERAAGWPTILGKAAKNEDPNVMYWLLKHGSAMFAC
ncbi:MAG: hypothetical protein SGILL_000410 [Bacillariaceae sp.]